MASLAQRVTFRAAIVRQAIVNMALVSMAKVQTRMERSGRAFVSHAVLDGVHALRMCVVNFRTRLDDVQALADLTMELGRAVDVSMRPRLVELAEAHEG